MDDAIHLPASSGETKAGIKRKTLIPVTSAAHRAYLYPMLMRNDIQKKREAKPGVKRKQYSPAASPHKKIK